MFKKIRRKFRNFKETDFFFPFSDLMRLALTKTHLPLQAFSEFIWKYTHAQSVYLCAAFEQLRGFV